MPEHENWEEVLVLTHRLKINDTFYVIRVSVDYHYMAKIGRYAIDKYESGITFNSPETLKEGFVEGELVGNVCVIPYKKFRKVIKKYEKESGNTDTE